MEYSPIEIKCHSCGSLSEFEEPFEFLTEEDDSETRPYYQWGGWTVVERFPSQFKWKAPSGSQQFLRFDGNNEKGGYPLLTYGLSRCTKCHNASKHLLQWPQDAYWQWEIRGEVLWAWNRKHAITILEYVKKVIRPSRYSPNLRYIPSHFLSSKVRDQVVIKVERDLSA